MKELDALKKEIARQAAAKKDYIAATHVLELLADEKGKASLRIGAGMNRPSVTYRLTDVANAQIAERLKIPGAYYNRMLDEAPALLAQNVNHWFTCKSERRLIRTLDGKARAFLSDRYRRIDHDEMLEAILPVFDTRTDLSVKSCGITEAAAYIKLTTPKLEGEVRKGDVVQAGIMISNSEVGMGCYRFEPFLNRLICENGMIATISGGELYTLKRYHVGRQLGKGQEAVAELENDQPGVIRALLFEVRDQIYKILNGEVFKNTLELMRASTRRPITGSPAAAVAALAKIYYLSATEKSGILGQMTETDGGELTQYGLLNAVTRQSKMAESYDRATELERLGGNIITLKPHEWRAIAEAA